MLGPVQTRRGKSPVGDSGSESLCTCPRRLTRRKYTCIRTVCTFSAARTACSCSSACRFFSLTCAGSSLARGLAPRYSQPWRGRATAKWLCSAERSTIARTTHETRRFLFVLKGPPWGAHAQTGTGALLHRPARTSQPISRTTVRAWRSTEDAPPSGGICREMLSRWSWYRGTCCQHKR